MNRLETCCIALYLNPENVAYFDSYRVECISQESENLLEMKIL